MNALSPKSTFLADKKLAGAWQDIVANPLFTRAAEAALLSYATSFDGKDGPTLAIVGMKLEGAKGFLKELITIGKLSKPDVTVGDDNLEPI